MEGIEIEILNFHKRRGRKSDKKTNLIHKKLHLPEKHACLNIKKSADPDNSVQDLHSFVLYSYLIGIYNVRSSTLTPKDDNLAVATLI